MPFKNQNMLQVPTSQFRSRPNYHYTSHFLKGTKRNPHVT